MQEALNLNPASVMTVYARSLGSIVFRARRWACIPRVLFYLSCEVTDVVNAYIYTCWCDRILEVFVIANDLDRYHTIGRRTTGMTGHSNVAACAVNVECSGMHALPPL